MATSILLQADCFASVLLGVGAELWESQKLGLIHPAG